MSDRVQTSGRVSRVPPRPDLFAATFALIGRQVAEGTPRAQCERELAELRRSYGERS